MLQHKVRSTWLFHYFAEKLRIKSSILVCINNLTVITIQGIVSDAQKDLIVRPKKVLNFSSMETQILL